MTKKKEPVAGEEKITKKKGKVENAAPKEEVGGGFVSKLKVSEDAIVEVMITEIASNSQNPRESAPNLIQMGFGVFNKLEGSDKPAVIPLGLSDKPEDKAEFCKLIEQFEDEKGSGIVSMANDLVLNKMIQPCRVRIVHNGYDLIIGCRRVLASLYNHCKHGMPASIRAIITEKTDQDALYMSFSENAHRLQMNPMEQARWFGRLRNAGMSVKDIEGKTKVDHQVVRQRLDLLKLPQELQVAVEVGELGVVKALKIVKGKEDPKKPGGSGKGTNGDGSRRRVPSLKDFQTTYSDDAGIHEEVRKWIAKEILNVVYVTFKEIQKTKAAAEGKKDAAA